MPEAEEPIKSGRFATTRWSAVLSAGARSSIGARALAWLCEAYWQPIFDHVRRRGFDHDQAQDLTQSFFARLLEKRDLAADPGKGRFRNYLLGALNHFIANEQDRVQARKRGGDREHVSFAESDVAHPESPETAEKAFARGWALAVLERVLKRLADEHEGDRQAQFAALKPFLIGDADAATYAAIGRDLGLSEGAVKVAVHRLRKRYRDALREEIAETVDDSADSAAIAEEMQALLDALRT